nr:hypothetical protein [uncultured Rhodopila sp.]
MDIFGFEIPPIFGIQIPKLAIVIAMGIFGYFVATFILKVGMSGFAGMATLGSGSKNDAAKPRRTAAARASASASVAFERGIVVASGADWEDIQALNTVLETLEGRKKATLLRQGDLQASKGAWWLALFEQAILHRILTLVSGALTLWDARNPVGAALSARSLLESGAVVLQIERQLSLLAASGRLADIDAYVAERAFSQPGGWIEQARKTRPVDVPNVIDEADRISPGLRFCYDRLSEFAAPEAVGQHAVFGAIDKTGTSAEFRDDESLDPSTFRLILDAARIVVPVAAALDAIDALMREDVAVEKV